MKLSVIKYLVIFSVLSISAHERNDGEGHATYLGNEAVMIVSGEQKIIFDPFFHNSFGQYTLVPEAIREKLFNNTAPYDDIDLVLITHAHEDHFDAKDMIQFLLANTASQLIAPSQAIEQMRAHKGFSKIESRIQGISLNDKVKIKKLSIAEMEIDAYRIPHSGWPERHSEVEHIVYRTALNDDAVVMHLGDSSTEVILFQPHFSSFKQKSSHLAFVPFWFELVPSILTKHLNAKKSIGIHVPTVVPDYVKQGNFDYFSKPEESRAIH
ncbi:MBL fold metallo-hydrolase [Pleionea sediminis]|uniref:MBL fold metallo-hydrolase n=1 Tax=Pleionea sediminis TaxID=2569479 RepID=UPI001186915E|nr:MBL fold metallo-hydrolase [Pleionea sediminis]